MGIAPPASADGKTRPQAERTKLMRGMSGALGRIRDAGDPAAAVGPVKTIISNARRLQSRFTPGSGGGFSRARPEIWQNMDDVKSRLVKLQNDAAKLLNVAENSGDIGAVKTAAGKLKGNCKGCHKLYRAPARK